LEVRGPLTDAQREDLRRIHLNQRLLLSLINDVLNFARLESGHVEFALRDLPVREGLAEMEGLIMPQLLARSLHYEVRPVDDDLVVRADPEKLQQIVLNLLTNAVKYTANHGKIELGAHREGDFVLIQVRDTGRGIPPEKLEQIFAPFVRIDTGYSRSTEGVGLGLAISRDLARGMGGDLTVHSTLGEGSTFTLRLPRS
jgi:signal transduction histidine kinase